MSAFTQFLEALGSPDLDAAAGYLHYRSTDVTGEAGASADIERIEGDTGTAVIISVWEWAGSSQGAGRERVGRLVFVMPSGELSDESEGDAGELAGLISSMSKMES